MTIIDQNTTVNSMRKALLPDSVSLDGRNQKDRLGFLSNFSTLINFYNTQNKIENDWSQFLLKDPLFLLANIANTDDVGIREKYTSSLLNLENSIINNQAIYTRLQLICVILDQLIELYQSFDMWTIYMKRYDHQYDLRDFLFKKINEKIGIIFWSIIDFREFIYTIAPSFNIGKPPVSDDFQIKETEAYLYSKFDQKVWNENKDQRPFWEVFDFGLDLDSQSSDAEKQLNELIEGNLPNIANALGLIGAKVINFLSTLVREANLEFSQNKNAKVSFPDTILLRSFCKILETQQNDLNGITAKHLDFYYTKILKQKKNSATPDRVFACVQLAANSPEISLGSNTTFKAGLNNQGKPILFETTEAAFLYPVTIPQAYTLRRVSVDKGESLYLNRIIEPFVIKKAGNGNVLPWKTFGGQEQSQKALTMGLVVSSPILYLNEGTRNLTLTLSIENKNTAKQTKAEKTIAENSVLDQLKLAKVYLSTAKAWLLVKGDFSLVRTDSTAFTYQLKINLNSSCDPIVPFVKNPELIDSPWPSLKFNFDQFGDLTNPIFISSLEINVEVEQIKQLELFNKTGKVNGLNPFPPFGPSPALNSEFFIGSTEIFSKPCSQIGFDLTWSVLPKNNSFSEQYEAYNSFIFNHKESFKDLITKGVEKEIEKDIGGLVDEVEKAIPKGFFGLLLNSLKGVFGWIRKEIKNQIIGNSIPENMGYFNNQSFKIDFSVLDNSIWSPLNFAVLQNSSKSNQTAVKLKEESKKTKDSNGGLNSNNLFSETSASLLTNSRKFLFSSPKKQVGTITGIAVPLFDPEPDLQLSPLVFSNKSRSGFLSMQLVGPNYGFGKDLYPSVMTSVALNNGNQVVLGKPGFSTIPNPPFTPVIKSIIGNYSASVYYDLTISGVHPLKCYSISPFQTVKVYDSSSEFQQGAFDLSSPADSKSSQLQGVALHFAFKAMGALFLDLDQLKGNEELSLNFQLIPNIGIQTPKKTISFSCLESTGWIESKVLIDQTKSFSCSGLQTIQIPPTVALESPFMPGMKTWMAISVYDDPDKYSNTIYLNSNGVELTRIGEDYLMDSKAPELLPNSITGPQTKITGISKVEQVFASFGGEKAESPLEMNQRISQRISSKGRLINTLDYYQLIQQQFNSVFYSSTYFCPDTQKTIIQIVTKVFDSGEAQAYVPIVNPCLKLKVEEFLSTKTSAFANVSVLDFSFNYVSIHTSLTLKPGIPEGFKNEISDGLNIFLSPWISSQQDQVKIHEAISFVSVSNFILSFEEVEAVGEIQFVVRKNSDPSSIKIYPVGSNLNVNPTILFVSDMEHVLSNSAVL